MTDQLSAIINNNIVNTNKNIIALYSRLGWVNIWLCLIFLVLVFK